MTMFLRIILGWVLRIYLVIVIYGTTKHFTYIKREKYWIKKKKEDYKLKINNAIKIVLK